MNIPSATNPVFDQFAAQSRLANMQPPNIPASDVLAEGAASSDAAEVREAFDDFVGQTFYGTMLKEMRKTLGKPAYMHGGQAEEMFQQQLDQTLVEDISNATADTFTGPMFDLFMQSRR